MCLSIRPAHRVFQDHKLRQVPVDTDCSGMCAKALRAACLEAGLTVRSGERPVTEPMFAGLVYLVPSFDNPTGRIMPRERRVELLQVAHEFSLLVVCDDVYEMLWYGDQVRETLPPRMIQVEREVFGEATNCVSNGTFSKILAPGVRYAMIARERRIGERAACA
jgi:DNA-binding transcriptional MocR family regulator